ncbi:type II secretion system F family protein [Massilia sp. BJB1822]|uniref:type II secretion system F family protein n=1 Tax=Massilia sp. BJB1822 TaxID=2744470 RepID=UPI00159369B4|nr:type II secretion system F family protein [Massilia sp. BJB1822]NVD96994.1 type II secretion system F family protein [Massilia sp. BJB1822]
MDMLFTAFAVLLFAAVIFMIEGVWLWWSGTHGGGARRIARRLRSMSARSEGLGAGGILKQRRYSESPWLERWLRRLPGIATLDRLLLQAGLPWTVGRLLGGALTAEAASLVLPLWLDLPALPSLLLPLLAAAAPLFVLLRARGKRLKKVEEQLPEAADFLARALRAGHSFANVLQMAGNELPEPLAGEFKLTYEEIHYGVSMNEALHNLAQRVPLTDLRYLVIAVLIQRESGGNLAELLGNVSRLTRARLKLLGQVRVQAAEGKMSAWVLSLLPLAVMLVLSLVNPGYVRVLWTDPVGIQLLWFAAGIMLVGVAWMRQMIRIRI